MKRILLAALCCALGFALAGCGSRPSMEALLAAEPAAEASRQPQEAPAPAETAAQPDAEEGAAGDKPSRVSGAGSAPSVDGGHPLQAVIGGELVVTLGDPVSVVTDYFGEGAYNMDDYTVSAYDYDSLEDLRAAWGEETYISELDGETSFYYYQFDEDMNRVDDSYSDYYASFMVEDGVIRVVTLKAYF